MSGGYPAAPRYPPSIPQVVWPLLLLALSPIFTPLGSKLQSGDWLTDWTALFTADRAANLDICLPDWLACDNKAIFPTLFAMDETDRALALARSTVKEALKAGVLYFALMFAAGFVLGTSARFDSAHRVIALIPILF